MANPMFKVNLPAELPITHTADVIVVGGGPGGIGSAVAAARGGADVILVEHYGFLGGMATAGEVNPFMPNHHEGKSLDTGIFEEWFNRMGEYGGKSMVGSLRTFDPSCARLAAEDLCIEAGVRLLYHHRVAHVQTSGKQITGIVLHSKSGLTVAKAKQYIDSTGDGDLAALAGCEFKFGSEDTGFAQPMTMCFKLKLSESARPEGADDSDLHTLMRKDGDLIQEVYKKAQADGRIECPRENVLIFRGVDGDIVHFNTTRVIKHDSTNGQQLSDAEVLARKQIRQLVKVLRDEVPSFKNCTIYSIATQIGIRESRRIMGRQFVTVEEYMEGKTYPDGIARVTYPIDIHNPNGTGTVLLHFPKEAWMEVPFGCLVAKDFDNLGIGARCISLDHAVHSAVRVMPPVVSIGQAIGTAAAMAIKADKNICEVDGMIVKEELIKQGRNLLPYNADKPSTASYTEEQREKIAEVCEKRAGRFSA